MMGRPTHRPPESTLYAAFAVFGGLWGVWGASIPAIRDQAVVTDGQLGTALMLVGAGALPAMLVTGRLVDRWAGRTAAALLTLLGMIGVLVAVTARDLTGLSIGLAGLGASSGAADVSINALAGSAQRASARPVISRAHATFSAAVVVASLVTGALRTLDAPLVTPFVLLAAAAVAVAVCLVAATDPQRSGPDHAGRSGRVDRRTRGRIPVAIAPLVFLGALGAIAFAVENGHQSWSALYLQDVLGAGALTASVGPAVFAAVVAVTRLAASNLTNRHPTAVLLTGSVVAAAGTALVGAAWTVPIGLLGLSIAAAGTAVLFPTLLGILTMRVRDEVRGSATSVVSAVAYLGFLGGPGYVGRWAGAVGLPGAMFALAALAAVLALLVGVGVRRVGARERIDHS